MGLVKLYFITNDQKYLDQARFFIDETGLGTDGHELSPYSQDHMPVREQDEAVGHAVRFAYLYSGVADVGLLTDDQELIQSCKRVWNNVVSKKLYVTGGIGARAMGEGFGNNYELPNMTAYCETCASIANVYWNHRMFLLTGDSKYYDVLERTLYNALLSGISLSGDLFFYDNVLESDGSHYREPWFGCACCPANVTRFIASVPGYVYAKDEEGIYLNLFVEGEGNITFQGNDVKIKQETNYPWDGKIDIYVTTKEPTKFNIYIRIPAWASDTPVPSNLYQFVNKSEEEIELSINGKVIPAKNHHGYALLSKEWKENDLIGINIPMPVRRLITIDSVINNQDKIALQRGPIVYCMEGKDQEDGHVFNFYLPDSSLVQSAFESDLFGGVEQLTAEGYGVFKLGNSIKRRESLLTFIPYYAWNNRGKDEMAVWIPRSVEKVILTPNPTIASLSTPGASTVWAPGLNDQFEPTHSGDIDKQFFYWWLKEGTEEWVQYDFNEPRKVFSSEVYWLNYDHYDQDYRVPESWELQYKYGDEWKPVENPTSYGTTLNQYNLVKFDQATTTAIRLVAKLQEGYSGGILEWRVK